MTIRTQVNEILGFGRKKPLDMTKVINALNDNKYSSSRFTTVWNKFIGREPTLEQAIQAMLGVFAYSFPEGVTDEDIAAQYPSVRAVSQQVSKLAGKHNTMVDTQNWMNKSLPPRADGRPHAPEFEDGINEACITPPANILTAVGTHKLDEKTQKMQDRINAILASED